MVPSSAVVKVTANALRWVSTVAVILQQKMTSLARRILSRNQTSAAATRATIARSRQSWVLQAHNDHNLLGAFSLFSSFSNSFLFPSLSFSSHFTRNMN